MTSTRFQETEIQKLIVGRSDPPLVWLLLSRLYVSHWSIKVVAWLNTLGGVLRGLKWRDDVDCGTGILSAEEGLNSENIFTVREAISKDDQNEILDDNSETLEDLCI